MDDSKNSERSQNPLTVELGKRICPRICRCCELQQGSKELGESSGPAISREAQLITGPESGCMQETGC